MWGIDGREKPTGVRLSGADRGWQLGRRSGLVESLRVPGRDEGGGESIDRWPRIFHSYPRRMGRLCGGDASGREPALWRRVRQRERLRVRGEPILEQRQRDQRNDGRGVGCGRDIARWRGVRQRERLRVRGEL